MSFRNYNAFLRAAKRRGLTHKQAQRTYKNVAIKLGRPARGVDVGKHPIIFAKEARRVGATSLKPIRRARGRRATDRVGTVAPTGREILSLAELRQLMKAAREIEIQEAESSAFAGNTRGKVGDQFAPSVAAERGI